MASFLFILLAFLSAVNAAGLSVNYPINAQLPPVARVSQPFSFVFADDTFAHADSNTKYSLSDAPAWLEVDSSSRTLSGTPHSDDDGSKVFKLVASNGSDSVGMDVTLIVTSDSGPTKGRSLIEQLEQLGPVSYPATLFIHPGRPFSIAFDPETFQNTHPATIYYGTSPNNTPLPSWIGFDPSTLTFAGNSPSFPGAGPQTFTFQLIASDVAGYSAVNETFQLSIGPHILAFNETVQTFNLTRGKDFSSPNFWSLLSMDDSPVSAVDVKSIDANLPDWLTMDKDNISLSGTPPKNAVNQNITIIATDTFEDQAKLMIRLEFMELFLETVEGCEATIGEDFMFVFNQSILTDNSVQLDVDLDKDLSSWLVYYSENKTLYGHVPGDMKPQKFAIPLKASQGFTTESQDFDIDVLEPAETHNGNHDPFSDPSSPSHKKAGIIAISVVIPVVVILSAIILFCCWRRRRKTTTVEEGEFKTKPSPPPRPARPDLPMDCPPGVPGRPSQDDHSDDWTSPITPASDLPKLELGPSWNVSSFDKQDDSLDMKMSAIPEPNPPPRSPKRSAFVPLRDSIIEEDKPIDFTPNKRQSNRLSYARSPPVRRRSGKGSRREPLKSIQPRVAKRESMQSSRSKRYSKRSSGISSVASGLPVRLSGAGHGAGGFGPPGHGVVHMSWQTTKASLMSDESSLTNMTPLFPRPPLAPMRHSMTPSIPENYKRVTMRAVEPDESTISEADSLEAFVHSRAKHRNSSNPLFSAQISRRTSSGMRAIERARSIRSRADTVSVSTFSDEFRQSIQGRPYSTALSVSEYGDENNRFSQYQNLQAPSHLFPLAEGHGHSQSQLSLAQDYRGVISPLPRFWSETSLNSAQRFESGSHPKPQPRATESSTVPQSSSMVSDLDVHLSRKASPQKATDYSAQEWQTINEPLEPPPPLKSASSRGLPVASSGELAFV
jgi:axial budding pattern protein 2